MSHFARVINNKVVSVIVADQDFINSLPDRELYIQTSYNTHKGQHSQGLTPLRYNYAAPGYSYDAMRDAFIPPRPYPSWTLNESECWWYPPQPYPQDGKMYLWDENTTSWKENK